MIGFTKSIPNGNNYFVFNAKSENIQNSDARLVTVDNFYELPERHSEEYNHPDRIPNGVMVYGKINPHQFSQRTNSFFVTRG